MDYPDLPIKESFEEVYKNKRVSIENINFVDWHQKECSYFFMKGWFAARGNLYKETNALLDAFKKTETSCEEKQ